MVKCDKSVCLRRLFVAEVVLLARQGAIKVYVEGAKTVMGACKLPMRRMVRVRGKGEWQVCREWLWCV